MKSYNTRTLVFLALCCDLGLVSKRLLSPFFNVITDALHIPGGIGTSFSLMFLVVAVALCPHFGCGVIMGAVQSVLALGFGMVGSMGILSPIGYIVPGLAIDLVFKIATKLHISRTECVVLANGIAAPCAAFTANCIVFHLNGIVLLLYLCVAASSGILCGFLGSKILQRLTPVICIQANKTYCKERE